MIRLAWSCLLLAGLSCGLARAQDDAVRTVYDIELAADPRIDTGKAAFLRGTATPYGHQFQVLDTTLDQPISVGLYSADPAKPLLLRVVKDTWREPVQELSTNAQGRIDLNFRTYDGFKLWVSAREPTDYQLVVWVGDEIIAKPPAVAIPASEYVAPVEAAGAGVNRETGAGAARFSTLELVLGALVLALLLGAVFLLARRKPTGEVR